METSLLHNICAGEHQGAEKLSIKAREEEFTLMGEMNAHICFRPTKSKGLITHLGLQEGVQARNVWAGMSKRWGVIT